ncbi:MAG: plastocyanin/azurin family copper-binding protein [Myxococcales bacterium]|jgi:plastocyanin
MRSTATQFPTVAAVALGLLLLGFAAGRARSEATGSVAGNVSATPQRYLAETVIYLDGVPGRPAPKTLEMDQKSMQFVPHVLAVAVGDTVRFWNHDTVAHNVFSPEGDYNLGVWPPGEYREHVFKKQGAFTQLCSLHPEMLAYVFVAPSRHAVVVDSSGHFTLTDVPAGKYQLLIWNSHLHAPQQTVVVKAAEATQASFTLHR